MIMFLDTVFRNFDWYDNVHPLFLFVSVFDEYLYICCWEIFLLFLCVWCRADVDVCQIFRHEMDFSPSNKSVGLFTTASYTFSDFPGPGQRIWKQEPLGDTTILREQKNGWWENETNFVQHGLWWKSTHDMASHVYRFGYILFSASGSEYRTINI